jgi:tetratricopeptide (TPR) repeat protein
MNWICNYLSIILIATAFASCKSGRKAASASLPDTATISADTSFFNDSFFETNDNKAEAEKLTNEGREKIKAGDYPGGIELFTEAIKEDSTYLDAYFERATANYTVMNYSAAVKDDDFLSQKSYPNPIVYARIGQRYAAAERWADALAIYKKGVSLSDTSQLLYSQLGNLQVNLNLFKDAIESLEKARELGAPETAVFYANLGYSLSRIGENRKAVYYLTKSIELNPDDRLIYVFRGYSLLNIREFASAEADYKFYLQDNPLDAIALYNLGRCQYEQKKYKEAIESLTKVSKIQPDYMDTYYLLGMCYGGQNDYKAALPWLDKAIKQDPNKAIYYYNRGIAKGQISKTADFCPDFQKALELGFKEAQQMIDQYCR